MTTTTIGTKYDATRNLDIAAVAKLVREDIKQLAAEQFPGLKASVTISRYSMGQSLSVRITAAPANILNPLHVQHFATTWEIPEDAATRVRYTAEGKAMIQALDLLVDAYNRRETDFHTDYNNSRFHASVDVCGKFERTMSADILGTRAAA